MTLTALWLGTPAQAHPARLHQLAPNVIAFASDGVRYAAWQVHEDGPLIVLDTNTGVRKHMTLPSGCDLETEDGVEDYEVQTAAASSFLLACTSGQQVFNTITGNTIALRQGYSWFRLGSRYVEGVREESEEAPYVENLTTGKIRQVGEEAIVDLDRMGAPGDRSICPKLRRRVRKLGGRAGIGWRLAYQDGVLVSEHGEHGEIAIERCRGRGLILEGQHVRGPDVPHNFDLRGGLLSWNTGGGDRSEESEGGSFRAMLRTYSLSTGRRYSWVIPLVSPFYPEGRSYGPRGPWGHSSQTAHTVFWLATRTEAATEAGGVPESWTVYWARL